jgi:hypothetical protein
MAFVHGKNSIIKVDNAAGTLVDISTATNSVELPRSLDTGETTAMGGTGAKTYVAGLNDGTVSISGLYDPATDAILSAAVDAIAAGTLASASVEWSPAGLPASATKPTFKLEVLWTSYSVSAGVGDVETFKLEGQRTGATTRAIV